MDLKFLKGNYFLGNVTKADDPTTQQLLDVMGLGSLVEAGAVLSRREKQVFSLLCQGHSARSAGQILHLSSRTVEQYIEGVKNKTSISERQELLHKGRTLLALGKLDNV